ncbi:MAG: hypothetical protein ABFD81_18445, partial [Syntrophaceae bacterium]
PGNAAFVPPPAEEVPECMSKLELFLHDQPSSTPVLLKAALAHEEMGVRSCFLRKTKIGKDGGQVAGLNLPGAELSQLAKRKDWGLVLLFACI